MHRLDLALYSHPKQCLGNGVRTHVNSKGKMPSSGKKFSSEEDRTHGAASSRTASPTHYKLSTSPSHRILTPGRPVPALTRYRLARGRVATGVPVFQSFLTVRRKIQFLSHWYESTRKNPVASKIRTPNLPLSRRMS